MNCYFLFVLVVISCMKRSAAKIKLWNKLAKQQGPNVCAVEHVLETSRFFSHPWTGGQLCGRETIVKFSCCHGYESIPRERGCPLVQPLRNIAETFQGIGATIFSRYVEASGLVPLLSNRGAFTLFVPRNEAFRNLTPEEQRLLNASRQARSRPPLLLFTVAEGRHRASDLPQFVDTLYREGPLIVTKFPNGVTTINCVPLVGSDVRATNGLIHLTESLILPTGRPTIAEYLGRSTSLSTMSAAVVRSHLGGALSARGPITLFAPIDEAWESLPKHLTEALMDDPALLKVLVHYHMLDSVWCSSVSNGESELVTVESSSVRLHCNESGQYVNEARILEKDIATGNGFVHRIDAVLIPDRVLNLAELLELRGLTFFLQLAEAGGLLSLLERPGTYTVFAPRNEAFEELSNSTLNNLLTDSSAARSAISFHIASGRQLTTNFIDGQTVLTIQGQPLRVKQHIQVSSVETSVIISPDEKARNGILHTLDKVPILPTLTLSEILEEGNYSIFRNILNQTSPNLLRLLSNASNTYTVFAPDDDAMKAMPAGMIIRLLADPPLLYQLAAQHIIPMFLPASGLDTGLTYRYEAVNGMNVTFRMEDSDHFTVAGLASITTADILATNGIIHQVSRFIDQALL